MKMFPRLLLMAVVSAVFALVANVHAVEWYDDFADGDAEDGSPVTWAPYTLAGYTPGTYDASSGNYVVTSADPIGTGFKEGLISTVAGTSFTDTSVRSLAIVQNNNIIDPDDPDGNPFPTLGFTALTARFDPTGGPTGGASGYFLRIRESKAQFVLVKMFDGVASVIPNPEGQ